MKQHITPEQVNELSHAGKEKLLGWLLENEYATYDKVTEEWGFYTLSIGQMIEFLQDKWKNDWTILLGKEIALVRKQTIDPTLDWKKEKEVCDALWEAVKEVLK